MSVEPFAELARRPDPPLDEIALSLAAEFGEVDADAARTRLDELGDEVDALLVAPRDPRAEADAVVEVLGRRHGFRGDRENYDHPRNSMLGVVLERRAGLPILLSVVYVAVGRRAGVALDGVGLSGHYVVGHFGVLPPVLLDPFNAGKQLEVDRPMPPATVRPWGVHETVLRMLNNLVTAYTRRNELGRAIRAAEMRLELPLEAGHNVATLGVELRALRARLN
ncbi:MAG: transglutaminase-like domain-containing protein [Actinomycetota bacterium]|nr:transglutaminase-like domain-containing protein [Actinomycetota bacterium]